VSDRCPTCYGTPEESLLLVRPPYACDHPTFHTPDFGRSEEVRVVNEQTGGEKGRKPERYGLLPWDAMDEVARVYAHGASKYADHNWRKGFDWSLSIDAAFRHMAAFAAGEDNDPESGFRHPAHAVFHMLALITFAAEHPELDDRFTPDKAEQACSGDPFNLDAHDWRAFYNRGEPGQLPDWMACNDCGLRRGYAEPLTPAEHREWRRQRGYIDPPDHHDCDCGRSMNGETCGCGLAY
jgi:hypothetical protein